MTLNDIDFKVDWLQFRLDFRELEDERERRSALIQLEGLLDPLDLTFIKRERALRFYTGSYDAVRNSDVGKIHSSAEFSVHYMGSKPNSLMILITGDNARIYNSIFTRLFKQGNDIARASLIRVDYAYDFLGDFNEIDSRVKSFVDQKGFKAGLVSSVCEYEYNGRLIRDNASTRVVPDYKTRGSCGCFSRLYEKGKESEGNPLWLRQEFEIRPPKFSAVSDFGYEAWVMHCAGDYNCLVGLSRWATEYVKHVFGGTIEFNAPPRKAESQLLHSFTHMCKQYSRVFARVAESCDMSDFLRLMQSCEELRQLGCSADIDEQVKGFFESKGMFIRVKSADIKTVKNDRAAVIYESPCGRYFKYEKISRKLYTTYSLEVDFLEVCDDVDSTVDAKRYIVAILNKEL